MDVRSWRLRLVALSWALWLVFSGPLAAMALAAHDTGHDTALPPCCLGHGEGEMCPMDGMMGSSGTASTEPTVRPACCDPENIVVLLGLTAYLPAALAVADGLPASPAPQNRIDWPADHIAVPQSPPPRA